MLTYLIIILIIGLISSKIKSENEYIFVSRKLTLPAFIATFVTTWYGGILEIGRFTYQNGIVTWVIFCLFYYISAIIFLKFFAFKIHDNNIDSIPEYFHKYYGYISGLFSSFIIMLISSPAPYIIIFSVIFQHVYEISYFYSILIGLFFSIAYLFFGGFRSIIRTDKIQFILMYIGFIVIIINLYNKYGGINYLLTNLPENHLNITSNLPIGYILSWMLISMITFIDPNIFQRIYIAKNKFVIKKGILVSIFFWIIFDLLTITTGLYASTILNNTNITTSPYLALSDIVLSPFSQSIFLISLLSIVMSTIDSFTFTSAITLSKEINFNKNKKTNVQIGILITTLISLIIIFIFTNVIDIWYVFGSIGASSLLIPLIKLIYQQKKRTFYPELTLILPAAACIIWIILDNPFGINCMYPGIFISICINYYS